MARTALVAATSLAALLILSSCGGGGTRSTARSLVDCLSKEPGFTDSSEQAGKTASGIYVPGKNSSDDKAVLVDFLHPNTLLIPATVVFHKTGKDAQHFYDDQLKQWKKSGMPAGQSDHYLSLRKNAVIVWPGGNGSAADRETLYGCLN